MGSSLSSPSPTDLFNRALKENPVMIFSATYCPYCKLAKSVFSKLGTKFSSIELDEHPDGKAIFPVVKEKTGIKTVPQIFICSKYIGGAAEIKKLLNSEKYHKNWIPYDLHLTCIAAHLQFIALGTNIGLVYWYDRLNGKLMKLVCADRRTPISKISLLDSVDHMLAIGNQQGIIAIFQIPKLSEKTLFATTSEGGTDCFHIENVHSEQITCLEWSMNGQKLFSGDFSGLVSMTNVDYSLRKTCTTKICNLKSLVTQMTYCKGVLLISSLDQSFFCYPNFNYEIHVVGGKSRQINGVYGGLINYETSSKCVYALILKPNWIIELAKTSVDERSSGEIKEKMPFKSRLKEPHKEIPLLNPPVLSNVDALSGDGLYLKAMGDSFVAFDNRILHILKIEDTNVKIEASCHSLKGILDLSVTSKKEIFILENSRTIIRIATFLDESEAILNKEKYALPGTEGGPGLEILSNFISNSGKKILNKFPKLMSLGEIGEILLGEVDTGEEASEKMLVSDVSSHSIIDKNDSTIGDTLSNLQLELANNSSLSINVQETPNKDLNINEESEEKLVDILDLKKFLPEIKLLEDNQSTEKVFHPDPLVHIPIDVPLKITEDECFEKEFQKLPLSIEIRKDPIEDAPNWHRLSGMGRDINNFTACAHYVIIQDDCERSFISYRKSGFKFWIFLKDFAPWHNLSISSDGCIIWRLYKSKVYSLRTKDSKISEMKFYDWIEISTAGIVDIYMTENDGYMLNGIDHTLIKHSNISCNQPFDPRHFVIRPLDDSIERLLLICDERIYALNRDKNIKMYLFEDDKSKNLSLNSHKEIGSFISGDTLSISMVKSFIGVKIVIVNSDGIVLLVDESKNESYSFSSSFLCDNISTKIVKLYEDSIWISSQSEIYLNESMVMCKSWSYFEIIPKNYRLNEIYCDGIYRNSGVMWSNVFVDSPTTKSLYYLNTNVKSRELINVSLPKKTGQVVNVSSNGFHTWMLDNKGVIYIRSGISSATPSGNSWVTLDSSQLISMNVRLVYFSLGTDVVWAVDNDGKFYMRLGSLSLSNQDFLPAWISCDIEYNDSFVPIKLVKIFSCHAIHVVWAIDDKKEIYCRTGINGDFRLGNNWTKVNNSFGGAVHLAVCDSHVWALNSMGRIYVRVGMSQTCPEGQSWRFVPGALGGSISSSACGSVFVLNLEGKLEKQFPSKFSVNLLTRNMEHFEN
uniref:Putative LOC100864967 [Apis florea] n=1 Tax=Lepeophtheirus salmonis TaxID=72036 RepID=A0A0K2ULF0_LEPSM